MIISVQILSKVLNTGDYSLIENNFLTRDLFVGYENEFDFIKEHYDKYGNVPDIVTFLDKFDEFEIIEVNESDEFLIDAMQEQEFFDKGREIIQEGANKLEQNSFDGIEHIVSGLENLRENFKFNDVEIISSVDERIEHSRNVAMSQGEFYIPTGFEEIDKDTNGLQRGPELAVIFARTNNCKSWVCEKMAVFTAEIGYSAGYFSPEMSAMDIGYRFDTLHGNLSNNQIRLGRFNDEFSVEDYSNYAEGLKKLNGKLWVSKPIDFNRKVTVSKLRGWIKRRKLDILFIDGIKYLTDERYKRGDSAATSLTNISEDLMDLSEELHIPIVVVVQANRGGVVDKTSLDTPELENIKDSDGIAQNASIVWAVRKVTTENDTFLLIDNKKARNGENGQSYKYRYDIDRGRFESVKKEDIDLPQDDEERPQRDEKPSTGSAKRNRRRKVEDDY